MKTSVVRIVSGGQTGADIGGLIAGSLLGIETGGWAPKGWRTEEGVNPDLVGFGLREHESPEYPPRTHQNIIDSDATLLFGDLMQPGKHGESWVKSAGSALTYELCVNREDKPIWVVYWRDDPGLYDRRVVREKAGDVSHRPEAFATWLIKEKVKVLNVAGNRESGNPGICRAVVAFLREALGDP